MALRFATQRAASRAIAKNMQVRGMATEKQIFNQIQATKNIRKITSSMKMVSAAKLKGDEGRLFKARPFNAWTTALCGEPKLCEDATYEELPQKCLLVPFSSERGLCGGVNSYISRNTRNIVSILASAGKECDIVVIGDKGRAQLGRTVGEKIIRSTTDIESPGTFDLAAGITTELVAAGAADYDAVVLIYTTPCSSSSTAAATATASGRRHPVLARLTTMAASASSAAAVLVGASSWIRSSG